jgi:hypothetical protein
VRSILLAAALVALSPTLSNAGILDESDCKNLGTPYDLDDTLNRLNKRIIACFNYQQDLARSRDADYRLAISELELRIRTLETSLRNLKK